MNRLDIGQINRDAPYEVYHDLAKTDYYLFETNQHIVYALSFSEELEIGGCMSYQFSISNENGSHGSMDTKIRKTIIAIIENFFELNKNVLLYICDNSDHREQARAKLFVKWFDEYNGTRHYTIRTANATVEEQGIYAAIIVDNSNPLLADIVSDFNKMSQALAK